MKPIYKCQYNTIGWDVKITNKRYYFFEGNFGPTNIIFDDYYYLDKFNFIKDIHYF